VKWHTQVIGVEEEEREVLAVAEVHQASHHATHHKLAQRKQLPAEADSLAAALLVVLILAQEHLRALSQVAMAPAAAVVLVVLAARVATVVV
jgi:hypothetical protein